MLCYSKKVSSNCVMPTLSHARSGGTRFWPFLVFVSVCSAIVITGCSDRGQREPISPFVVGLITNNPNGLRNIQGFKDGMAALGYRENDTIEYLFKGVPEKESNLENTITEMVSDGASLIFTAGTPTGIAAHRVTAGSSLPVVFGVIADPVGAGVMTDLNRPGGNMTGVKLSLNQERRLELLLRISPDVRKVFVPFNPDDSAPESAVRQIERIAGALGIEIIRGEARDDHSVTDLLAHLPADIDAIFLVPDSTVNQRLSDILAIATRRKLPVSGPSTAQVEEGALTTYGFVHHEVGIQAAQMADQIIRGANPAELPVQTAEFFLSINLQAADTIGLEIADDILRQADTIIR